MAVSYSNNYAAAQLATNWSVLPHTAILRSWALFGESHSY